MVSCSYETHVPVTSEYHIPTQDDEMTKITMVISRINASFAAGKVEMEGGRKMSDSCGGSWRGVVEKGDVDMLRTVECLRGRLLAERLASRAAKDEAELMAKRLTELDRLLVAEIKARNTAEKRLRYAFKKLQSLKLVDAPGISDVSEESSIGSSSSSTTSLLSTLEKFKFSSQAEDSTKCGDRGENESSCFSADSSHPSVTHEVGWNSAQGSSNNDCLHEEAVESNNIESKSELISDDSIRARTVEPESEDEDNTQVVQGNHPNTQTVREGKNRNMEGRQLRPKRDRRPIKFADFTMGA